MEEGTCSGLERACQMLDYPISNNEGLNSGKNNQDGDFKDGEELEIKAASDGELTPGQAPAELSGTLPFPVTPSFPGCSHTLQGQDWAGDTGPGPTFSCSRRPSSCPCQAWPLPSSASLPGPQTSALRLLLPAFAQHSPPIHTSYPCLKSN